jgi:hypothetical protein
VWEPQSRPTALKHDKVGLQPCKHDINSVVQIAALNEELLNSKGHPNSHGWACLKGARKQAVFKGIIGVLSCPEAEIGRSLPRGFPTRPERSACGRYSFPETGDLPATPWEILAELEKTGPGSQEHQHLNFAGNLEKVGRITLPFQLAAKGELGVKHPKQYVYPRQNLSGKALRLGKPGILPWEKRKTCAGDPPPQAVYKDDQAPYMQPKPAGRSMTVREASTSRGLTCCYLSLFYRAILLPLHLVPGLETCN